VATLDPAAQPFVDLLTSAYPPLGTGLAGTTPADAEKARRILAEQPIVRPEPPAVGSVTDRTIPGPAGEIPVRIYRPTAEQAAGARPPIVVYYHGGGWVIGDLESHDGIGRSLTAGAGVVTMSVDYRRAPEHHYPAAANDAYAAAMWASEHADELGGDRARLVVAGDSAGGNLAAVTALRARDSGGPPLAHQILVYPVTDVGQDTPSYRENGAGFFLTSDHMRWFWQCYLGPAGDGRGPYASPMRAINLGGLPSATVLTAECDLLRDEGNAYAERLRAAGVPVTARCYPGMYHGFFGMPGRLDQATAAHQEVFDALRAL
jgi:acetyl esterase